MTEDRARKQAIRQRMEETGEKYTEARRAVLAQTAVGQRPGSAPGRWPPYLREAELLGHNGIGCEHLLLGVLADQDDPAAQVLVAHGVTLDAARRRIAEVTGDGWQDSVRWTYSPRATVVCKLAEIEAERLGHAHPQPGHTLLAMITEGGGVPMALFDEFGVDVAKLREDVLGALEVPDDVRETYLGQRIASERRQARRWGAAG